ncbi:MAG: glycosyltransferase family 2 protein [Oceanococcus sp.]
MNKSLKTRAPLISVIIPSFNQGRFLRGCIESVLEQEYHPLEIIVVDGASSDETVAVLKSCQNIPQLRWISEPDTGPASAVNKGLAMANGQIAGIQSVDDYYLPGALHLAARTFEDKPNLGFIYGEVRRVGPNDEFLSDSRRPAHSNELCLALCMCVPQSSAFFDLRLAQNLGGWREEYFTCDWELWLRMMFYAPAIKLDRVLSVRRIYPDQRTGQRSDVLASFLRMVNESQDLATASRSMQRAAAASRFSAQYFFGQDVGPLQKLVWLFSATIRFPKILFYVLANSKLFAKR